MQESTKYKLNSIIIIFLGVGILLYVGLRIIFPEFLYFLNEADQFKVQILKEQIGDKYYLAITPLHDYPYSEVKVEIKSSNKFEEFLNEIDVYKDYTAQLYPIGETINSQEELRHYLFYGNNTKLPNGTLVSYNDAIYFISKGKRRPFLGPEIFVRLNYNWDDISAESSQIVAIMPEDEKIHFISAHPDGTILKTKEGRLFLVWDKKRLPIRSEEIFAGVWNDYYTIEINSDEASPYGICKDVKQFKKTIECSFESTIKPNNAVGHTYLLELPKNVYDSTSDAIIAFDTLGQCEMRVVKESLKRVKDSLYLKYAGYIL